MCSKMYFIFRVTLSIYSLSLSFSVYEWTEEEEKLRYPQCDPHLSRKFLSILQPISAPSEDEEDSSEVKQWSSTYFCRALKTAAQILTYT